MTATTLFDISPDEPRVLTVVPASGWWLITGYKMKGALYPNHWQRTRVATWAVMSDNSVEALVAGHGSGLALAKFEYDSATLSLYADDDLEPCTCGRRSGDDPDRGWCADCPGPIEEWT